MTLLGVFVRGFGWSSAVFCSDSCICTSSDDHLGLLGVFVCDTGWSSAGFFSDTCICSSSDVQLSHFGLSWSTGGPLGRAESTTVTCVCDVAFTSDWSCVLGVAAASVLAQGPQLRGEMPSNHRDTVML